MAEHCKQGRTNLQELQEQLPVLKNTRSSVQENLGPKEKTPNREELRPKNERESHKAREVKPQLQQKENNLRQLENSLKKERDEKRELQQQSEKERNMRRKTEQQLQQMEGTLKREREEMRELRQQSEREINMRRRAKQLLEETRNQERKEMQELQQKKEREINPRGDAEQQLEETLKQTRQEIQELRQWNEKEIRMRQKSEQLLEETLNREREEMQELQRQNERETSMRRQTEQQLQQMENTLDQFREEMRELRQQNDRERNMRRETEQERNAARTRMLDLEEEVEGLRIQLENLRLQNEHTTGVSDWVIGREEVQLTSNILGVGAWATVSEGIFRGSKVAVKRMHDLILSPYNVRLFEREMTIASRCRHPNLLQFIGATRDNESPIFVMEILDTSLRSILHQRALLPAEFTTISLDVTRALNYLHLNRPPIIHRDLSSANVLLWQRGIHLRGKVSDYGTANFTRQCRTRAPGAAIYSAPEALTECQSPKVIRLNKCIVIIDPKIR